MPWISNQIREIRASYFVHKKQQMIGCSQEFTWMKKKEKKKRKDVNELWSTNPYFLEKQQSFLQRHLGQCQMQSLKRLMKWTALLNLTNGAVVVEPPFSTFALPIWANFCLFEIQQETMAANKLITLFFVVLVGAIVFHNASYFSRSSLVTPLPPIPVAPVGLTGSYAQLSTYQTSPPQPQIFSVQSVHIPPSSQLPLKPSLPQSPHGQVSLITTPPQQQPLPPQQQQQQQRPQQQQLSVPPARNVKPVSSQALTVINDPTTPPKKITKRSQEFLPEYNPCCDTRARGKKPGLSHLVVCSVKTLTLKIK
jgi:hypothetical protein